MLTPVRLAIAAIALHVADDSFLQPQPGTSAGDHLLSGLLPLAVLALAAAVYGRVRPGWQATLSLLLGFFGLVGGIEAVHYTMHGGPTGDDFTGFASIAAGLTLWGVAATTLWQTRRTDDRRVWRYGRRVLHLAAAFVLFSVILFPLGFAYVGTHAARPPVGRIDLGPRPALKVTLRTSDGLRLRGSYVPSRNGAAVIVAFGRKGTQPHARMLARHGYGVLIFDRRGEGLSDGDPNPYAWDEGERDLNAAIAFLQGRADVDPGRIGGLGLSVGGETFLQTAAHNHGLHAVVAEGASTRSVGELGSVPGAKAESLVVMSVATTATSVFADAKPPEHLIDQVGRISPTPLFLIYATKGTDGEEHTFNRAFIAAAREPKAIWEIPEAKHVGGLKARPREYEQRVVAFFDRSLQRSSSAALSDARTQRTQRASSQSPSMTSAR